jgi:hypothetical protein
MWRENGRSRQRVQMPGQVSDGLASSMAITRKLRVLPSLTALYAMVAISPVERRPTASLSIGRCDVSSHQSVGLSKCKALQPVDQRSPAHLWRKYQITDISGRWFLENVGSGINRSLSNPRTIRIRTRRKRLSSISPPPARTPFRGFCLSALEIQVQ